MIDVPDGPFDESALPGLASIRRQAIIWINAGINLFRWRPGFQQGGRPLSEPVITQLTDAYTCDRGSKGWISIHGVI